MKKLFVLMFLALQAGLQAQVEITVRRAESSVNAGFQERIFIDGRQVLQLRNGQSGTVRVQNGEHTIHATLYTLTTPRLSFSAGSRGPTFTVTVYSLQNFVVEEGDGGGAPGVVSPSRPQQRQPAASGSVEGALEGAADKIREGLPRGSRVAIVYVTADDEDVAEFIAGELEYIMVENGVTVIDRSQLDRIRQEQRLQMSGAVDDRQAVSIGRMAGASVIITGAVTGTGSLRRLRLRALDTQSAQVLSVASERY